MKRMFRNECGDISVGGALLGIIIIAIENTLTIFSTCLHGAIANEFIAPKFIVRRVQDNISATKRGGKEKLGDAVAIFSILSIGIGLGSMFIRRGRLIGSE